MHLLIYTQLLSGGHNHVDLTQTKTSLIHSHILKREREREREQVIVINTKRLVAEYFLNWVQNHPCLKVQYN